MFFNRRHSTRRANDLRLLQRERELEATRRICDSLSQPISITELVENSLHTALDVVNAQAGSVLLSDPETKELVFRHVIGEKAEFLIGRTIPWDQGIAGAVFTSGQPYVIANVKEDSRHLARIDESTGYTTRDMITLPLKRAEKAPIGVMQILNKRAGTLDQDDLSILTIISALTTAAIEQARLFEEAKLAEMMHLLGDIGHDMKNLLTPVIMGTGLLDNEMKDLFVFIKSTGNPQAHASHEMCDEVISMVRDAAQRTQDRVKEIADCVKGLSTPPDFKPCMVMWVAESVMKTLRLLAEAKDVTLRVHEDPPIPAILADERRLFNAIYNLVNNAIPEVPRGGSVTVSGCVEPRGDYVLLTVADTGRGMPPEVCKTLLTSTGAVSMKAGGTGLGVKIVKDVVKAHGGHLSVESKEGAGTTFFIRLPFRPPGRAQ